MKPARLLLLIAEGRDITERKQAEQTLREQEELYNAMVNQAPDGVVLVDTETLKFTEFNDTACKDLGYSREEFARLTVLDINAEYSREWYISHIPDIVAQGHVVFETFHRHKDGSPRNVRVSLRVVQIRGRQYFICFWTDITEHFRLLQALRLREHYQRALLDNFPFAAWMKDEEGRYLAVNRQLAAYLGFASPDELVGKTNFEVLPPELSERIAEEDRKVLTSGRTKHAEEQLPANGVYRWFDVYQSPVAIDGRVIGTVGCNWDITERKKAEEELRSSEAQYRFLTENMKDVVWILDTETMFIRYISPSVERLRGFTPEEVMSVPVVNSMAAEAKDGLLGILRSRLNDFHAGKLPTDEYYIFEMPQPCKDGSVIWVEANSKFWINEQTGHVEVHGVSRDISVRKKAEIALRVSEKRYRALIELSPMRSSFVQAVGSSLRTAKGRSS